MPRWATKFAEIVERGRSRSNRRPPSRQQVHHLEPRRAGAATVTSTAGGDGTERDGPARDRTRSWQCVEGDPAARAHPRRRRPHRRAHRAARWSVERPRAASAAAATTPTRSASSEPACPAALVAACNPTRWSRYRSPIEATTRPTAWRSAEGKHDAVDIGQPAATPRRLGGDVGQVAQDLRQDYLVVAMLQRAVGRRRPRTPCHDVPAVGVCRAHAARIVNSTSTPVSVFGDEDVIQLVDLVGVGDQVIDRGVGRIRRAGASSR